MSSFRYIVRLGDTLQRISLKCLGSQAKWKVLAEHNHLQTPYKIFPGQTIEIPLNPHLKLEAANPTKLPQYVVRYGDSLWKISADYLSDPLRWRELAFLNKLENPQKIFVGQTIYLPRDAKHNPTPVDAPPSKHHPVRQTSLEHQPATMIPLRAFFFIIADEFNPLSNRAVRTVIFPQELQGNPELLKQIIHPEKYGFSPKDPLSKVPIGRHVLGRTDSNYISVSQQTGGSPRFEGKRYWVNISKLEQAGSKIYKAEDIAKDLDRIAAKTKDPAFLKYIEDIRYKSLVIDKENLVEGSISPKFIKGTGAKALSHSLQFVQGVGIVLSVYDLGKAGYQSIQQETPRPIIAETVRQAGGWGSAMLGFEIGAAMGGLFGIETGPGAILTAGIGGMIFGAAGYFGADWVAQYIYESE